MMKAKKSLIVSFIVLCAVWMLLPQSVLAARTMKIGESYTAYAGSPNPSYPPSGNLRTTYIWSSSNPACVEVNGNGPTARVTARSAGSAWVSCKAAFSYQSYDWILKRNIPRYEEDFVYSGQITVEKPAPRPHIDIYGKTSVKRGRTITLKVKKYGVSGNAQWSVDKKKIATINKKTGKLKGKRPGTVTVTVRVGSYKKTCKVRIK